MRNRCGLLPTARAVDRHTLFHQISRSIRVLKNTLALRQETLVHCRPSMVVRDHSNWVTEIYQQTLTLAISLAFFPRHPTRNTKKETGDCCTSCAGAGWLRWTRPSCGIVPCGLLRCKQNNSHAPSSSRWRLLYTELYADTSCYFPLPFAATRKQRRLLHLLCWDRLAALDAPARAAILNGMQASGLFKYMGDEGVCGCVRVCGRVCGHVGSGEKKRGGGIGPVCWLELRAAGSRFPPLRLRLLCISFCFFAPRVFRSLACSDDSREFRQK